MLRKLLLICALSLQGLPGGEVEKYFKTKSWYDPYLSDVSLLLTDIEKEKYCHPHAGRKKRNTRSLAAIIKIGTVFAPS